jgi:hypothetical protein
LDLVFDPVSYREAVLRQIKPRYLGFDSTERAVLYSQAPENGCDIGIAHRRMMLLYMACQFGRNVPDPAAVAYSCFGRDWLMRNFKPLGVEKDIWSVGAGTIMKDVADFALREKLLKPQEEFNSDPQKFWAVREKLKDLWWEQSIKRAVREDAAKRLAKRALPGCRRVVKALTDFACEAYSVDDRMHSDLLVGICAWALFAERRGLDKEAAIRILHEQARRFRQSKEYQRLR